MWGCRSDGGVCVVVNMFVRWCEFCGGVGLMVVWVWWWGLCGGVRLGMVMLVM